MARKVQTLSIDLIVTDAGTQSRLSIHEETVEDYADVIRDSNGDWPFPAVDVFHDGSQYVVADGFHRVMGAQRAKRASIPCTVHKGTIRDARIYAMTANDRHGLRMNRADKRACVEWLLDNGGKMTQAAIAEAAGVTSRLVKMIVAERNPLSLEGKGKVSPYPTKSGVSDEGASPSPESDPFASSGAGPEEAFDPFEDVDALDAGTEADPVVEEGPRSPGKPPKQYPRSHWFKQYDQSIGPVLRLIDQIAHQVGECKCAHHQAVHEHLNRATDEMMTWLGGDE